jgi:hypothetical protein
VIIVPFDSKDVAPERSTRGGRRAWRAELLCYRGTKGNLAKNRMRCHMEKTDGNKIMVSKKVSVLLLGSWIS